MLLGRLRFASAVPLNLRKLAKESFPSVIIGASGVIQARREGPRGSGSMLGDDPVLEIQHDVTDSNNK